MLGGSAGIGGLEMWWASDRLPPTPDELRPRRGMPTTSSQAATRKAYISSTHG